MKNKPYSTAEFEILKTHYPYSKKEDIMALLPERSHGSIVNTATLSNIKKAVGYGGQKQWADDEIEFIKNNYADMCNDVLKLKFNCSEKSLYGVAHKLGIKKSKEYMSLTFGAALAKAGEKTRYAKGNVSANKGKKITEYCSIDAIKKIQKSQFKKGNVPYNIKPIGYERVSRDGYVEIKIGNFESSTDNYNLKHRVIWEQHFGPILNNEIIEFLDNNKFNIQISNLRKVTRAENCINNQNKDSHILKKYFKIHDVEQIQNVINNFGDVIDLKRNEILLTRKLKQNVK